MTHRFGTVLATLIFIVGLPSSARAQMTEANRSEWMTAIDRAMESLDADRLPDTQQMQTIVLKRVEEARGYFQRSTDAANAAAWMTYVDADPLVDAINTGQEPVVVGRIAREIRGRLLRATPGLELPALVRLRTSLEGLINSIVYRDKSRGLQQVSRQLQGLQKLLREIDGTPTAEQAATLSAITRLISASGQATDLIQTLRQSFDRPNVSLTVSERLIQQAIEQEIQESSPVRDCILGTRIVGTALLSGRVTATLIPSSSDARILVALDGQVATRNRGYNGPVRLRTISDGRVTISRQVRLDDAGVKFESTHVDNASLSSKVTAIEHPLKIVRRIARQQAAQKKRQADRIALRKMSDQVRRQFSSQMDEALGADNLSVDRVRGVLQRFSFEKPTLNWNSTEDALRIQMSLRRGDQLAAILPSPPMDDEHDLLVQIHESAVDNFGSAVFAGRTVREEELGRLLRDIGMEPQTSEDSSSRDQPFRIDFARTRPMIFEARDGQLRLGVRGTRFVQGGRELKRSMEITASYAAESRGDRLFLRRQGDVSIVFPGTKRLSVTQSGLRTTIKKKFSAVFPESLFDQPIEIPSDFVLESLRGRSFAPSVIESNDGWFSLGIR